MSGYECGDCPAELPSAGEPCLSQTPDGTSTLSYGHCAYATDDACGYRAATIECVDDQFAVVPPTCE